MAATVYLDKIEGSGATAHVIQQTGVRRAFTVTDLPVVEYTTTTTVTLPSGQGGDVITYTPNPGWNSGLMFEKAVNALSAVTGGLGSACPGLTTPNYLEEIQPQSVSGNTVTGVLIYKGFPKLSIKISTNLQEVDSNLDKDGKVVFTSYTYPSSYPADPALAGLTVSQGFLIPKKIPDTVMVFRYTYTSTGTPSPTALIINFSQTFVGTVNATAWPVLSFPSNAAINAPRTWLIESCDAESRDGGVTYEVAVSYHFRPQTWDFLVVFIKRDDGKPPTDRDGSGNPVFTPGTDQDGIAVDGVWTKTVKAYIEGPMNSPVQPYVPPP
jgi:hypothetical protein